ncbi:hypothetical protein F4703DRAFT_1883881 [Phycomyces blakesleeanus]
MDMRARAYVCSGIIILLLGDFSSSPTICLLFYPNIHLSLVTFSYSFYIYIYNLVQ